MSDTIRIRLLAFGSLRDAIAQGEVALDASATVATLLATLSLDAKVLSTAAIAVNQIYAQPSTVLHDGDEVAILPPVSGGADPITLTREPVDVGQSQREIKSGSDGAVVVFDGIVRNNTRGRQTLFLDYEAYEEMALKQMAALRADALSKFAIREITITHRLGRIDIGETSVLILVASAHRGAAFDACRWVIDTLKKTVPIWKKEHFLDGAVWIDGEPFPEEIVGQRS